MRKKQMTDTTNHLSVYLIVGLNAACHILLIWRLKIGRRAKLKYCAVGVAIPLLVMTTMRLMVALGAVHGRLSEQGGFERALTMLASMLLIAGPLLATGAAVVRYRKKRGSAAAALAA
jgi:hypothetical protein